MSGYSLGFSPLCSNSVQCNPLLQTADGLWKAHFELLFIWWKTQAIGNRLKRHSFLAKPLLQPETAFCYQKIKKQKPNRQQHWRIVPSYHGSYIYTVVTRRKGKERKTQHQGRRNVHNSFSLMLPRLAFGKALTAFWFQIVTAILPCRLTVLRIDFFCSP